MYFENGQDIASTANGYNLHQTKQSIRYFSKDSWHEFR